MREGTPWRTLLVLAAQLGVTPPTFWCMSLCEWRALVASAHDDTLPRNAFEALAAKFPDGT